MNPESPKSAADSNRLKGLLISVAVIALFGVLFVALRKNHESVSEKAVEQVAPTATGCKVDSKEPNCSSAPTGVPPGLAAPQSTSSSP